MNTGIDEFIIYLRRREEPIQNSKTLCSFDMNSEAIDKLKDAISGVCGSYEQCYPTPRANKERRVKTMIEEMENLENINVVMETYHRIINNLKEKKVIC